METRIVGGAHQFYRTADMRMVGKRSLEWDLNDWKWDGDLFLASPITSMPTAYRNQQLLPVGSVIPESGGFSNSSSSCSDEVNLEFEKRKRELEKRRRVIVIEDDNRNEEPGILSLKLGGHGSEREAVNWEGTSGKKAKLVGSNANRAVCQVDDCNSDLSSAKDYHRRHKVCELHSKATRALVGNVMQRFCQQCSRFHVLQEFDEGKRSCRRRLAGHNKRRRKTQPDAPLANGSSRNDDQASGHLLISLLKILSNMHSNTSDQTKDHDMLTHLLKSIASNPQAHAGTNISAIINDRTIGNSEMVSDLLANGFHGTPMHHHVTVAIPSSQTLQNGGSSADDDVTPSMDDVTPQPSVVYPMKESPPGYSDVRGSTGGQTKLTNIDLNDVYIDSDDSTEDIERPTVPTNPGTVSFGCPVWLQQDSHQSSPPQASGNSDSASAPSPSSSSGEAQSRTDRIVFKLFGKEPNDFPIVLRAQILDWLSHSPTDIESYIRPGCVVLTIYLRLAESEWDELCDDLSSSLSRLLDASDDTFWNTGWVYIRVQDQIAFIYNGQVILDASLPLTSYNYSDIFSISPIAISASEKAQFTIKGLNLSRPSTRLHCALEGKYLIQEKNHELADSTCSLDEHDECQYVKFSCSIPAITGRGFFEIEDNDLSSNFFPFIVAENEICSEIRTLENAIDLPETDEDFTVTEKLEARTQAIDFVYEMGWLLHRNQLKSRFGHSDPNTDTFSLKRFKWLMDFSMNHDWCAVVKKLLDVMVNGTVNLGECPSLKVALTGMGLLHKAVRKNSRPLVHLLLRYVCEKGEQSFLFTPDAVGPGGFTPLHIAAGRDGSENVLDALLNDPGSVGIKAWKSARDSTGSTPEDYARLRGHYSYIHLYQKKLNKKPVPGQVSVDIPAMINSVMEIEKLRPKPVQRNCKLCDRTKTGYGNISRSSLVYRPAMLSMVAIAAVCVCVALLFKSSPEVLFVFRPFCWEMLEYGSS